MNDRQVAGWIFVTLLSLFLATGRGHFTGTDEIGVFRQTQAMWTRGALDVGVVQNAFPGRGGRWYSQYGIGQSILAMPLYGLGDWVGRHAPPSWRAAFAGAPMGTEPWRWGGDVEIFFVGLLNAFVCAALCALFFIFTRRLGGGLRASLSAALLVAVTTQVWLHATMFLQHPLEALLLLATFYLLFLDRERGDWRLRAAAGALAGALVNVRFVAAIAFPMFTIYLVRKSGWRPRALARALLPFLAPIAIFGAAHLWVGWIKFGVFPPTYNHEGWKTPLLHGLFGYLLSPGMSIFLYSPLLLLLPWIARAVPLRDEKWTVLAIAVAYLVCFSKYTMWHGLWSAFGPRYLMAIVPLLLLPLGPWLTHAGRRGWWIVAPLAAVGFVMQVLGVSLNWSYVYYAEGWPDYKPPFSFLFIPEVSPPVGCWRSFWAGRNLDLWALKAWYDVGPGPALGFTLPLLALFAWGLRRLWVLSRDER